MSERSNTDDALRDAARAAVSPEEYVAALVKVARGRTDVRGRLRALAELASLAGYSQEKEPGNVKGKPTVRRTKFRGFLRTAQPDPDPAPAKPRRRTARRPSPETPA